MERGQTPLGGTSHKKSNVNELNQERKPEQRPKNSEQVKKGELGGQNFIHIIKKREKIGYINQGKAKKKQKRKQKGQKHFLSLRRKEQEKKGTARGTPTHKKTGGANF